jgi:hypothetical protein
MAYVAVEIWEIRMTASAFSLPLIEATAQVALAPWISIAG